MCCAPFSKLRLAERQSGSDQAGIASLLDPGERSEPGPSPQTSCCTNSAQPSLWIVLSCKLPKGNLGAQPLAAGSSGHVMAGSLLSLKEVCFSVRDAPSLSHLDTRQHKTPHLLTCWNQTLSVKLFHHFHTWYVFDLLNKELKAHLQTGSNFSGTLSAEAKGN